jgi:uncharacterized protein (TIGR00106 family)
MSSSRRIKSKVIADISIYPIGLGTSLGVHVQAAYNAMRSERGVRLVPSAMSTNMEADDLDSVFRAVKKAHATLIRKGAKRIAVYLRIDHRLDKAETIEYKIARIQGRL